MSRLVVIENLTLDGVMQAPGAPDEDTRGGFTHGGWAAPYSSDAMGRLLAGRGAESSAMLLGARTYRRFAEFWPKQPPNPYTDALNATRKYVASTTMREPLPWQNSELLEGDVATAVAALKKSLDGTLTVLGSGDLVRTLAEHDLVDEYALLFHPLVLGTGIRLFEPGATHAELRLVSSEPTTTGVVICRYEPLTTR